MNDKDSKIPPGHVAPNLPDPTLIMPMGVFLGAGSSLCAFLLTVLYVACFKITDGNWPTGIKLYAIAGIILFFFSVQYAAGGLRVIDLAQLSQRLSIVQMLIVVAFAPLSGIFLTWFFHG